MGMNSRDTVKWILQQLWDSKTIAAAAAAAGMVADTGFDTAVAVVDSVVVDFVAAAAALADRSFEAMVVKVQHIVEVKIASGACRDSNEVGANDVAAVCHTWTCSDGHPTPWTVHHSVTWPENSHSCQTLSLRTHCDMNDRETMYGLLLWLMTAV